ncbi:3'-5' exonuclease [Agromyces laixinhei]|uniref:3'-5' exonuclease n=1 Tax=Agromyces laixinhei TaxID=2585717 RepID=UPI001116395B|nr:3'-5' exonuclease [Agromyces laixinhei]
MPNLIMTKMKGQKHEKAVDLKIMAFLRKLTEDDTIPGLNIERMNHPVDERARTGRVDIHLRAVLYQLDPIGQERTYVYAGTWEHDEAIERARTRKLQINPVNGIPEFIESTTPADEVPAEGQPTAGSSDVQAAASRSFLTERSYFRSDLVDEFGFTSEIAERAFAAPDEDALLTFAASLENDWQASVLLEMAVGSAISQIKESLGIAESTEPVAPVEVDVRHEDARLVDALKHPAAQMQFTFIDNDEELQRVIEGADFGAWRVFLHPDQRKYATAKYHGPFRLTGGAGTGKTVVLIHRARNLSAKDPASRVVLTTYTRALADNLRRDLERLDPDVSFAGGLGESGVLVRGVDALVAAIRERAGAGFGQAATRVIGGQVDSSARPVSNDSGWDAAVDDSGADLAGALRSKSFLSGEYLEVVLPNRVTTKDEYFAARRPGRGIALDRAKRAQVWKVVEHFRRNARINGTVTYAELAAIAAGWLAGLDGGEPRSFADHLLIDEAQDLTASHWQFLRAFTAVGDDDMFIADDIHQRIYGRRIVLSRLGIPIVGRSRRLSLNYRTTAQNLRYALGLLEGAEFIDAQGDPEDVAGYRSARLGPDPRRIATTSAGEQYSVLADTIRGWLDQGVRGETIAVLTASNNASKDVHDALAHHDIHSTILTTAKQTGTDPVVLTMHTSKGMEFSRVVLFDMSDGSFPSAWASRGLAPEDRADQELRERSLLYVASSRARDELVVLWNGRPSELLRAS